MEVEGMADRLEEIGVRAIIRKEIRRNGGITERSL